ncbi:YcaO-like family protein, partial [Streptomyces sp. NPDC127091]|uniref:YcaO-like family protein n=1 Tax=Streptomyces sp. NPDC127091 TaxID=3347134 RepID=UPI003655CF4B
PGVRSWGPPAFSPPRRPPPPARGGGAQRGGARADGSGPDVHEDLLAAVDAVTSAGFDVVVVDQTAPEQRALGLHTVKVLVPGLLPLDFGWTRQRARHMPRMRTALREAGLRPDDLTEADLNPGPHPFP